MDTHTKHRDFLHVTTCIVLGIAIYSLTLLADFTYDDDMFITENPSVQSLTLGNVCRFFLSPAETIASVEHANIYRPLRTLSFAIDYRLWGLQPWWYHLVNIILHAGAGVTVYFFVRHLTRKEYTAFLTTLFFILHPVQTEAVNCISHRAEMMFSVLYLLTILLYHCSTGQTQPARRVFSLYVFSCAAYFLGLLSKETTITLPLVLVVYEWLFVKDGGLAKRLRRLTPFFVITAVYLGLRHVVVGKIIFEEWWGGSPYSSILTVPRVVCAYLRLLILPWPLTVRHSTEVAHSIFEPATFVSIFCLCLVAVSGYLLYRKRMTVRLFAFLWLFITLLPGLNIVVIHQLVVERFLYLPSMGFCLFVADSLSSLSARKNVTFYIGVLVLFYSGLTILRSSDWLSDIRLWKAATRVLPADGASYFLLGNAYEAHGQLRRAIQAYETSLTKKEYMIQVHWRLAGCYQRVGELEKAIVEYHHMLQFEPESASGHYNLGIAYGSISEFEKAVEEFKRALECDPDYAAAHYNLAVTLQGMPGADPAAVRFHLERAKESGFQVPESAREYFEAVDE
ncbi:MAG: tetratricopeptide repeat protein [Candidatus Omnitrophica bacterium]|nr:tetratricopeptide repeat protein [Candidatus Omnitrophota bacterium]